MDPKQIRTLPRQLVAFCRGDTIRRQRAAIVPRAVGRVLEIGIGSGRNLPFYDADKVDALTGTAASNALREPARLSFALTLYGKALAELRLATHSIDTVVITGALRRMADPGATLVEIRRVLTPGGRLLFCEHGKAPDARLARWQRRLTPPWRLVTGGGQLDLDLPALLNRHGFVLEAIEADYLPGRSRLFGFTYWGAATVA